MAQMANWKNVNNWHWVDKNCTVWANEYLKEAFKTNIVSSNDKIMVKVKRVDSIEGDVDLNQRKGKVLYFYDLKIKCSWRAETLDKSIKANGTFTIPEFSNEVSSPSELSFHVEITDDKNEYAIFRQNIASVIRDPVFKLLGTFQSELERVHGSTILVPTTPNDRVPESATVAKEDFAHKNIPSYEKEPQKVLSVNSLKQDIEFFASPQDIMRVLINPDAITIWSRNPAYTTPVDSNSILYTLFQGHVQSVFSPIPKEDDLNLNFKWRLATWPKDYYSDVSIRLVPGSSSTTLKLEQHGIPLADYEQTKANWKEYYWNSIKRVYGFGITFS